MGSPAAKPRKRREVLALEIRKAVDSETGEVRAGMFPRFASDRLELRQRGYRIGDEIMGELRKPRILGQHRKAHLLGALAVAQLEGFEALTQHQAIKRLQRESGICCEVEQIDAAPVVTAILAAAESILGQAAARMLGAVLPEIRTIDVLVAQSLAFDRMEQGEFERFYAGICQHLAMAYWPELEPLEIERMAELMEREHAA
ncbi:MAG TPA: hypothetical protein VIZ86_16565 [Pseudomonas sp.]